MLEIALNDNYDDTINTDQALSEKRSAYAPISFNYFEGIDIHHALLSKDLRGGIAFVGTHCDSSNGFGLSASL